MLGPPLQLQPEEVTLLLEDGVWFSTLRLLCAEEQRFMSTHIKV
jgi:hypothetical protein